MYDTFRALSLILILGDGTWAVGPGFYNARRWRFRARIQYIFAAV